MSVARRLTLIAVAAGLSAVAVGMNWQREQSKKLPATEVSVLLSANSPSTWLHFVHAVQHAAADRGLRTELADSSSQYSVRVDTTPVSIRFCGYRELGHLGLRRRTQELCRQARPPLAIVGGTNSAAANAIGEELFRGARSAASPLFLITYGTCDQLPGVGGDKTFRFGRRNSYQANVVVERLRRLYDSRGLSGMQLQAAIVRVADDPFTRDLTRFFSLELARIFGGGNVEAHDFTLPTGTAGFEDPTVEETNLAKNLVDRMAKTPNRNWVLVLPAGADAFRRLNFAMHAAFRDRAPDHDTLARDRLVILAGDSLDFGDFNDPRASGLRPDYVVAPTIFFTHTDPRGVDGARTPAPVLSEGLFADLARALLTAVAELGDHPTPSGLSEALKTYHVAGDSKPYFENGERRDGGGAIVANVRSGERNFELVLPERETLANRPTMRP